MINFNNEINTLQKQFKNISFNPSNEGRTLLYYFNINNISFTFELLQTETDPKDNTSLPAFWFKHGYTKKRINNYLSLNDYIDTEERCFSSIKINPTIKKSKEKKRYEINFKYLKENTIKNAIYLINKTYKNALKYAEIIL